VYAHFARDAAADELAVDANLRLHLELKAIAYLLTKQGAHFVLRERALAIGRDWIAGITLGSPRYLPRERR
jgi:hypothetical protein